jgi:hypothetical protein
MVKLLEQRRAILGERHSEWHPSQVRRVVVRMVDGDLVPIGTAPNRASALALARRVVAEFEGSPGDWPVVGDRILRPDAIVSIDVVRMS